MTGGPDEKDQRIAKLEEEIKELNARLRALEKAESRDRELKEAGDRFQFRLFWVVFVICVIGMIIGWAVIHGRK